MPHYDFDQRYASQVQENDELLSIVRSRSRLGLKNVVLSPVTVTVTHGKGRTGNAAGFGIPGCAIPDKLVSQ